MTELFWVLARLISETHFVPRESSLIDPFIGLVRPISKPGKTSLSDLFLVLAR